MPSHRFNKLPSHIYLDSFNQESWTQAPEKRLGLVHIMDALWSEGGQKKLFQNLEEELQRLKEERSEGDEQSETGPAAPNEKSPKSPIGAGLKTGADGGLLIVVHNHPADERTPNPTLEDPSSRDVQSKAAEGLVLHLRI